MNQTLTRTPRARTTPVRKETVAALRDMAFVLSLTQRVSRTMKGGASRR
jgi:hypothetical protein